MPRTRGRKGKKESGGKTPQTRQRSLSRSSAASTQSAKSDSSRRSRRVSIQRDSSKERTVKAERKEAIKSSRKIWTQKSSPSIPLGVARTIKAIVSPMEADIPISPLSMIQDKTSMALSRQTITYNMDLVPILNALADTTKRHSVVFSSAGGVASARRVWPWTGDKAVTVVHTTDPLAPMIMPVIASAQAHTWTYPVDSASFVPLFDEAAGTRTEYPGFQVLEIGYGSCPYVAAPFDVRPPMRSRSRDGSDSHAYFWLDSTAEASTNVTLSGMVSFGTVSSGTNWMLALNLYVWDYEGGATLVDAPSAPFGTVTSNSNQAVPTLSVAARSSGWYRVAIRVYNLTPGTYGQVDGISLSVGVIESCDVVTGFLLNRSFMSVGSIADAYVFNGSTCLISPRFPHLTTEGMIQAFRPARQYPAWYIATASAGELGTLDPGLQFNNGQGGQLSKGIYSVGHPGVYPKSALSVNAKQPGDMAAYTANPVPAYIVGDLNPFGTFNLVTLSLSSDAVSAQVRITVNVATTLTLFNQLVSGTKPCLLLDSDVETVLAILRDLPIFTENPLHEFILKGAGLLNKWANNVAKLTERVPAAIDYISGMDWLPG